MFHLTSKYFSFFNSKPPARWVAHITRDFLTVFSFFFVFSIRVFFYGHWRLTGQQRNGGDYFLFHSTTSTRSRTFTLLFATLHVRWLSHIFNRRLYLPDCYSMRFTTLSNYHLIDWWCEVSFCFVYSIFGTRFLLQQSWYGKPVDSNSRWLSPLYYKRIIVCIIAPCTNQAIHCKKHVSNFRQARNMQI